MNLWVAGVHGAGFRDKFQDAGPRGRAQEGAGLEGVEGQEEPWGAGRRRRVQVSGAGIRCRVQGQGSGSGGMQGSRFIA